MEESKKKSGFATAGLVLGIIGICTSFIPVINNVSFALAIIGIIFAILALIKKSSKGMAIATIVICFISIIITVQSQQTLSNALNEFSADMNNTVNEFNTSMNNLSGDNTENILESSCDIVLGEFEISVDKYGFVNSELPVKVTNKTSEKKSFSIHIEAVLEDGTRITSDYIYANDLNAGQSQNFKAFDLVSSDKVNEMKTATFNIVEVSMY